MSNIKRIATLHEFLRVAQEDRDRLAEENQLLENRLARRITMCQELKSEIAALKEKNKS